MNKKLVKMLNTCSSHFMILLEMSSKSIQHIRLAPLLMQWTVHCLKGMAHEIAELCFH